MNDNIYRDIADLAGGNIYIGISGPVRTGKSTFIRRFMEQVVLPGIGSESERARARDELPQSAPGRTVMTCEPKFIPENGVDITTHDGTRLRVKLIDCVGYLVPGAIGDTEDGNVRMVSTPWSDSPLPFKEAAELGTEKVIREHSTIGMLVTTDGTIGELGRDSYIEAEERVASQFKEIGKPFAIILNSSVPDSAEAHALAMELEEKYGAPVALVNCLELDAEDFSGILSMLTTEFPVREIGVSFPGWVSAMEADHWLMRLIHSSIAASCTAVRKIGDVKEVFAASLASAVKDVLGEAEGVGAVCSITDMSRGACGVQLSLPESLWYQLIGEISGINISSQRELIEVIRSLAAAKREYDKYAEAIEEVNETGYGVVMPDIDDLTLDDPELVRQAGGYGVRLRASAPSIHMIRAGIEAEISPIVGTEAQSEELVRSMQSDLESDPKQLWQSNLFGKSLYEMVNDGLHEKLENMPKDARDKLGDTLSRVINEGSGGLICIIL